VSGINGEAKRHWRGGASKVQSGRLDQQKLCKKAVGKGLQFHQFYRKKVSATRRRRDRLKGQPKTQPLATVVAFAFRPPRGATPYDYTAGSGGNDVRMVRENNMTDLLSTKIPPRNANRTSLMALRPRHLAKVERIARRAKFDRAIMHEFLLENYDRLFGPLRWPKAKNVPSDKLRKSFMILSLLDLVQARRDEIEDDDARAACST